MGRTGRTAGRAGAVAERLRRVDPERFVDLCAALWAARGYETRVEGDRVLATRGDERLVVLVRPRRGRWTRVRARLRGLFGRDAGDGADPVTEEPVTEGTATDEPVTEETATDEPVTEEGGAGSGVGSEGRVDLVAAPVDGRAARRLAARLDARFVGPAALTDLLLYGVSRADADGIARRYLGAPVETLVRSTDATPSDESDGAGIGLTTLVAVAGVVCLVTAAAAAGVWTPADADTATGASSTGAVTEPTRTVATTAAAAEGEQSASDGTTNVSYPPGVGDDAVDVDRLADAHARAIENRPYRFLVRQSGTETLDGSYRWDGVWQHAVVEDERTWLYSVVGYADAGNDSRLVQYTVYADGEFAYRNVGSGERFDRYPIPTTAEGYGPHTERVRGYLRRYLATTEVRIDQPTWHTDPYRIVATGRPTRIDRDVANYTATAFVSEEGFVSRLSVEYVVGEGEDAETVRLRLEYAAVDEAEVHRPGWYREATAVTSANTTRD